MFHIVCKFYSDVRQVRERKRDGIYLRVRTQLSFALQLQGGGG